MIQATFILFFALNNLARGYSFTDELEDRNKQDKWRIVSDWFISKGATSLYAGLFTWYMTSEWVLGLVVGCGLLLWAVLGWSKYFSVFHNNYNTMKKHFILADIVGDFIYRKTKNGKLAGGVGMSMRGLLIFPLFLVLYFFLNDPWVMLYGIICGLMMGPVYYIAGIKYTKYSVGIAELLYGAVIGFTVGFSLNLW